MPGFIDAHRHIAQGNPAEWLAKRAAAQMQEFLDAGFTTVLCAICPDQAIELRQRIESGTVKGPRLLLGSIIPLARAGAPWSRRRRAGAGRGGDPARFDNSRPPLRPTEASRRDSAADTIKAVEAIASKKYDYIKTVITTTPGGPETDTLKLIVSEGKKRNLPTITHAVSVIDTLAAVEARPDVLVHTPHIGQPRGGCGRGEEDRGRRHPDDLDAGGVRPALRRGQHAALPRRAAVPVGDAFERRAGAGERAPAVGGRHLVRLRHRHELAAEGVARRRAARAAAWCSRRATSARSWGRARRGRRSSRIRSARSSRASSPTWC